MLGIEFSEIRPRIQIKDLQRTIRPPYVCIATQSTAACKLWQYDEGWQAVIDYLNTRGFEVVLIQKEKGDFQRIINKCGDYSLQERMTDLMHCEFFIGLGSGLSWLAWALDKPVVLISGFSEHFSEFETNCHRVINEEVCHGCWNSTRFVFDRSDWNWCPLHRDTPREFECSRKITPDMVIEKIDQLLWGN
jgi:autotransporter strand-loop-strand O-heptosyltransferase